MSHSALTPVSGCFSAVSSARSFIGEFTTTRGADWHKFDMIAISLAYPSGEEGGISLFRWFLPAFAMLRGRTGESAPVGQCKLNFFLSWLTVWRMLLWFLDSNGLTSKTMVHAALKRWPNMQQIWIHTMHSQQGFIEPTTSIFDKTRGCSWEVFVYMQRLALETPCLKYSSVAIEVVWNSAYLHFEE